MLVAPEGTARLPKIVAERNLGDFFQWFGVTGYYLPSAIVIVVLVCWHIARRDAWRVEIRLYVMMLVESVALAVPLFVFAVVLFRDPTLQPMVAGTDSDDSTWYVGVIHSIGAGVYEEFLFRLTAIALLHLILVDVLALPARVGATVAVTVAAVAFARYHFESTRDIELGWFLFLTLAGGYFAAIYILRGFGVVAITHTMYDIFVTGFNKWQ